MPNWVFNSVTFPEKQDFKRFVEKFCKAESNTVFLFSNIIPEPETKDECPKEYLLDETGMTKEGYRIQNDEKDWFNWYAWHCDKWGVKWEAMNFAIREDLNSISFDTAWGEPIRVYEKLARDGWRFSFAACGECNEWIAEGHSENGKIVFDKEECSQIQSDENPPPSCDNEDSTDSADFSGNIPF